MMQFMKVVLRWNLVYLPLFKKVSFGTLQKFFGVLDILVRVIEMLD